MTARLEGLSEFIVRTSARPMTASMRLMLIRLAIEEKPLDTSEMCAALHMGRRPLQRVAEYLIHSGLIVKQTGNSGSVSTYQLARREGRAG
jgi:hypothetical protein